MYYFLMALAIVFAMIISITLTVLMVRFLVVVPTSLKRIATAVENLADYKLYEE